MKPPPIPTIDKETPTEIITGRDIMLRQELTLSKYENLHLKKLLSIITGNGDLSKEVEQKTKLNVEEFWDGNQIRDDFDSNELVSVLPEIDVGKLYNRWKIREKRTQAVEKRAGKEKEPRDKDNNEDDETSREIIVTGKSDHPETLFVEE